MREGIIDFLTYIRLFDGFNQNELEIITRHMNLIEINKDEILFKEGDRGDYIHAW